MGGFSLQHSRKMGAVLGIYVSLGKHLIRHSWSSISTPLAGIPQCNSLSGVAASLFRFNHNPPRQTLELGEERSTSPHGGDTQLVSKVRATKYLLVRNPSVSTCIKTDIKTPSPRDGCSRKASLPTPHSHLLPRDHRSSSHRASCTGVCCSMGL
jgi:hypothetical protein